MTPDPGRVVEIWTAAEKGAPVVAHDDIDAVAGHGLEGDRKAGLNDKPGRQVTLVAKEAIDALVGQGIELPPGGTRRNLVTEGVDLNALVGARFSVGDVELVGARLCHPCTYLEGLQGLPGLKAGLAGRGGLNADIVRGGTIHVGDAVVVSAIVANASVANASVVDAGVRESGKDGGPTTPGARERT
jgi:MOSC domain-containing protein YiiM